MKKIKAFFCFIHMKRARLCFIPLFLFSFSFSFGQYWVWGREATSGLPFGLLGSMASDKAGNAFIAGYFLDTLGFGPYILRDSSLATDAFIAKYDGKGNILWANQSVSGGTGGVWGYSVSTDNSGNSYMAGTLNNKAAFGPFNLTAPSSSYYNLFLVKYDSNGTVQWADQTVTPYGAAASGSGVTADKVGNTYVTGVFMDTVNFGSIRLTSPNTNMNTPYLAKYDPTGKIVWAAHASCLRTTNAYSTAVTLGPSGSVFITGDYNDTITFGSQTLIQKGRSGIFVAKYDTSGKAIWAKSFSNVDEEIINNDYPRSIAADKFGNTYITGNFKDSLSFGSTTLFAPRFYRELFLAKLDPAGNPVWAIQGTESDTCIWYGFSVALDSLNNVYVGAGGTGLKMIDSNEHISFGSLTLSLYDSLADGASVIAKFDTAGHPLAGTIITGGGTGGNPVVIAVQQTSQCVYLAGSIQGTAITGYDTLDFSKYGSNVCPFLAKWSSTGTLAIDELKVENGKVNIYPNPFSNTTTISVESSKYKVESYLELFDLTGQKLKQVEFSGNTYTLSAEGLTKGMYFIRVRDESGSVIGTSKIVVQ